MTDQSTAPAPITQDTLVALEQKLSSLKADKNMDSAQRDEQMRATRRQIRRAKDVLGISYGRGTTKAEGEGLEADGEPSSEDPSRRRLGRSSGTRSLARTSSSRAISRQPLPGVEIIIEGLLNASLEKREVVNEVAYCYALNKCVKEGITPEELITKFKQRWPEHEPRWFGLMGPDLLAIGPVPQSINF